MNATNSSRSSILELSPTLNRESALKNSTTTISFSQHDSQLSITSTENDLSRITNATSYESPVTGPSPIIADEKVLTPSTAVLEDTSCSAPKENVQVKYSLELYDTLTLESATISQDNTPFNLPRVKEAILQVNSPSTIFEVVTKADGFDLRRRNRKVEISKSVSREETSPEQEPESTLPPLRFEDVSVTNITEVRIEIHSQTLLSAIREVVDYYPNQNLSGDMSSFMSRIWSLFTTERNYKIFSKIFDIP